MDNGTSDLSSDSSREGSVETDLGSARGTNSDIAGALTGKCLSESKGNAMSGTVTNASRGFKSYRIFLDSTHISNNVIQQNTESMKHERYLLELFKYAAYCEHIK